MHITPPIDSSIRVDRGSVETALIIPQRPAGGFRIFVALFLLAWLGGWAMGLVFAGKQVLSGTGGAFLIFWLGGWSFGGLFAVYMLYRILRPSVPERVVLRSGSIAYDSGVPPFRMFFGYGFQKEIWRNMFPKRRRLEFSHSDLQTMVLRETSDSNRLTVDRGAERIDIATGATEVERQWLYGMLREVYS